MSEESYIITTPDGQEFDIPLEGSLGLLALGDVGLMAWRSRIEQVKREMAARSSADDGKDADDGTHEKARGDNEDEIG